MYFMMNLYLGLRLCLQQIVIIFYNYVEKKDNCRIIELRVEQNLYY